MNTAHDPRKRNIHDPENQYVWADELDSKKLLWNSITNRRSTRRTGFYHRHLLPSLFGDVVMSKWTGSMLVMTAHQYVVEAESYDEARDKIVSLFEEGVVADHTFNVDYYPERVEVDNVCEEDEE
jgi:hypothetical protein